MVEIIIFVVKKVNFFFFLNIFSCNLLSWCLFITMNVESIVIIIIIIMVMVILLLLCLLVNLITHKKKSFNNMTLLSQRLIQRLTVRSKIMKKSSHCPTAELMLLKVCRKTIESYINSLDNCIKKFIEIFLR